jgi:lysophospholipase
VTPAPLDHQLSDGPAGGEAVFLRARDGISLRIAVWPGGARGTVFIFPGRTEFVEKYGRAAGDLATRGYGTVCVDWRGQGASARLLRNPMIGHVRDFREYQHDVQAMISLAQTRALPRPWHILSHSMGGTIALRSLIGTHPFSSAAFSGPMWGILLPPSLRAVAWTVSTLARGAAQSHRLTPTAPLEPYLVTQGFAGNQLTTDAEMFAWMKAQVMSHRDWSVGGPSLGWLHAALLECAILARLPSRDVPILTSLGTAETIVAPAPIHARMARWPMGRLDLYEGAKHEIMMETPAHRQRFFDAAADWFGNYS